jgi:CheY-like chemotaxis protein
MGFILKIERGVYKLKDKFFKIYLKNIMSDLSQKELAKFEKSFDFNELEFEKALILAVDDVASNRNIISEILVKAGLTVETAENGEKAVEFISQKKPDLILMDIIMPGMDGVEATRKIKASEGCKNIPVIALTASAGFLKTRSVLNIFDDYLEKPYRLVELLNVLLKYLNYTKKIKRKNELKNKETINLKDIKNPDKLIKILNNEILPEAEILKNAVIVGRTRELGAKVKELGSLHKSDLLSDCGAKLISSCEYFDIEKIEEEIKKLFSLIININKLREGDDEK